jgi:hypothetical protein
MTTPADVPAIDYTNKDYASLRSAMLDLARFRLPEWTDQTPSDLGVVLTDMVAYVGDVILYYQDRIASELFPTTARERRSVLQLMRLIGYELAPPQPARADLLLTFRLPPGPQSIAIPTGAQFLATQPPGSPATFEYLGPPIGLDLRSDQVSPGTAPDLVTFVLPVSHSRALPPTLLGSSTGEANQAFQLPQSPVLLESLVVEVDEGAGWVRWDRRDSFLYSAGPDGRTLLSTSDSRDYTVQFDENAMATVLFGDGVFGRIPPIGTNNIRATCRVGGGAAANVPAGSITRVVTPLPPLLGVTNPAAAAGGADAESSDNAVRNGPLVYRSGHRAVTLDDYMALARQAGGVEKVRAISRSWNLIDLIVAPEGAQWGPVPESLRNALLAWFEDKRMAGTLVRILDASTVPVAIAITVRYDPRYQQDALRQQVADAIAGYLAYDAVDFGQTLYPSDLFALVEAVPGVIAATLTRFNRADQAPSTIDDDLRRSNLPALADLPDFIRDALVARVAVVDRIDVGAFELPVLAQLDIALALS